MPAHGQAYAGDPNGDEKAQKAYRDSRNNFLALVFCLMLGTAAMPSTTEGRPVTDGSCTMNRFSRTARIACHEGVADSLAPRDAPVITMAGSRFAISSIETGGDGASMS